MRDAERGRSVTAAPTGRPLRILEPARPACGFCVEARVRVGPYSIVTTDPVLRPKVTAVFCVSGARKGVRELDLTDAEAQKLGGRPAARRGCRVEPDEDGLRIVQAVAKTRIPACFIGPEISREEPLRAFRIARLHGCSSAETQVMKGSAVRVRASASLTQNSFHARGFRLGGCGRGVTR